MSNNPPKSPPEEVELDEILDQLLEAKDWLRGAESTSDVRAGETLYKSAHKALYRWREAYADKARIDLLEHMECCDHYMVAEEGEAINICHGEHKTLISALRKQQGDK